MSDFQTAIAPATKTVEVNQTIVQNGRVVTLQKIESSDFDTRFYVSTSNV